MGLTGQSDVTPPPQNMGGSVTEVNWQGVGMMAAAFGIGCSARMAFERAATSLAPAPRSFHDLVVKGGVEVITEYRTLYKAKGLYGFIKHGLSGSALVVTAGSISLLQGVIHSLVGVTEEDINERNRRWVLGKGLGIAFLGSLLYVPSCLWGLYLVNRFPSPRNLIRKVLTGADHFYAPFPLFLVSVMLTPPLDVIRAKLLHWHKKYLYPDLMPKLEPYYYDDDLDDAVDPEQESVLTPRRLTYYTTRAVVQLVGVLGLSLVGTPMDALVSRMNAWPELYGCRGTIGAIKQIYHEDGLWGFYRGFLANTLFVLIFSSFSVESEANTGITEDI